MHVLDKLPFSSGCYGNAFTFLTGYNILLLGISRCRRYLMFMCTDDMTCYRLCAHAATIFDWVNIHKGINNTADVFNRTSVYVHTRSMRMRGADQLGAYAGALPSLYVDVEHGEMLVSGADGSGAVINGAVINGTASNSSMLFTAVDYDATSIKDTLYVIDTEAPLAMRSCIHAQGADGSMLAINTLDLSAWSSYAFHVVGVSDDSVYAECLAAVNLQVRSIANTVASFSQNYLYEQIRPLSTADVYLQAQRSYSSGDHMLVVNGCRHIDVRSASRYCDTGRMYARSRSMYSAIRSDSTFILKLS